MQIALINTDSSISTIGDIKLLFPNVSFPVGNIDPVFLSENSALEVVNWEQFNSDLEKQEVTEPYIKDGKVYTFITRLKTEQELQEDSAKILLATETKIRDKRNELLKDSDWTQVTDAPVDKTAWAIYRQALRDITQQEGFPFTVVFPNPPL